MLERLSQNIVDNEMANISMVLQTPTLLTTWYSVDANMSETLPGWKNIDEYIGKMSTVFYDRIENLPMCGVDNLISQAQFDEEIGYDENLESAGVIYPNTIWPKPNDCFTINNSEVTALYVVTDIKPVTVRSNPFIEISFRLLSRSPKTIEQLNLQVHDEYTTMMSPLGHNHSLVVKKAAQLSIDEHVKTYLELVNLYKMLFYDENKAAFVFDGYPDQRGMRAVYIDMMLWKFMFDEGVIIYDSLVTYANSNFGKNIQRIYTGCPDLMIDDYHYHQSIIWRLYSRESNPAIKKGDFDKYRYPDIFEPSPQITKYQGQRIWYMREYMDQPCPTSTTVHFYLWDDEFLCRIRNNDPYPNLPLKGGQCTGCENKCTGCPVLCYNPYLRNVIINWYNDKSIDWDAIQITADRTVENYYLLPIVLGIYKQYIQGIK